MSVKLDDGREYMVPNNEHGTNPYQLEMNRSIRTSLDSELGALPFEELAGTLSTMNAREISAAMSELDTTDKVRILIVLESEASAVYEELYDSGIFAEAFEYVENASVNGEDSYGGYMLVESPKTEDFVGAFALLGPFGDGQKAAQCIAKGECGIDSMSVSMNRDVYGSLVDSELWWVGLISFCGGSLELTSVNLTEQRAAALDGIVREQLSVPPQYAPEAYETLQGALPAYNAMEISRVLDGLDHVQQARLLIVLKGIGHPAYREMAWSGRYRNAFTGYVDGCVVHRGGYKRLYESSDGADHVAAFSVLGYVGAISIMKATRPVVGNPMGILPKTYDSKEWFVSLGVEFGGRYFEMESYDHRGWVVRETCIAEWCDPVLFQEETMVALDTGEFTEPLKNILGSLVPFQAENSSPIDLRAFTDPLRNALELKGKEEFELDNNVGFQVGEINKLLGKVMRGAVADDEAYVDTNDEDWSAEDEAVETGPADGAINGGLLWLIGDLYGR